MMMTIGKDASPQGESDTLIAHGEREREREGRRRGGGSELVSVAKLFGVREDIDQSSEVQVYKQIATK